MEVVAEYESSHSDEDVGDDAQQPEGAVVDARQLVEAARRKRLWVTSPLWPWAQRVCFSPPSCSKSAVPEKEDDLEHDLGALATLDTNPIDVEAFRRAPEQLLSEVCCVLCCVLLTLTFCL
jgi:hypothetical protein